MSDVVVSVEHVSKKFCRSLKQGMLYTSTDVGRDMLGLRGRSEELRPGEFWAVNDVSFELKRGESLGLIGHNGAGKSTLLKMLNGIIRPDKGRIQMRGRVGALIEVGAGFHPMLSGRENIYVNGTILGMSKREVDAKFDEIVEFSGLDPAILDAPVKSYSSGMYVRLGFSVAVHCRPDILLIDEVLSVGDVAFIGKCRQRLQQLREEGVTFILVSHSMPQVEAFCQEAMLLQNGKVIEAGPSSRATMRLRQMLCGNNQDRADRSACSPSGLTVTSVGFKDESHVDENGMILLQCGTSHSVKFRVEGVRSFPQGVITVSLVRLMDDLVVCSGYLRVPRDIPILQAGSYDVNLPFTPMPGEYRLQVTLSGKQLNDLLDEGYSVPFRIGSSSLAAEHVRGDTARGVCVLPVTLLQANTAYTPASKN